ncbi:MAG: ABC transporter substrate-binding protein [Rhodoferax sp.]|nr:ABC transporter substrate-binding protein [Rhodoferax sp.]
MKRSSFPTSPATWSSTISSMSRKPVRQVLALTVLAAASCAAMATEYTVVVLQSLTGGAAFIGSPVKDGMVLAAEEINKKGEMGAGNSLKVIVADDANDRTQTLPLLTRYAADPSILLVMGPTSGALATASANAANDLKLPLMTTTNSTDVLKAGPWSGILTQPAAVTIPYLANYAADKLKVKNCTVIGISDVEAYVTLQKTFETAIKAKGVTVGAVESIKGSDSDFAALATKVAGGNQDCVFISAAAPQSANIVIQLRQAGLDPKVRIMGHNALASPQFAERGGKAVEGVYLIGDWVPGGADDLGRAFAAAYKAKYNTEADNWAAVGYGGMRVAAAVLKAAGPNPTREAVRVAMGKAKDIKVVVGQGTYSVDAERVPRVGMNVLVLQNGKFVLAP